MERQCAATKANGFRCRLLTEDPSGLCYSHNPKYANQRVRTASKGGRGRATKEVRELRSEFREMRQRVDKGSLSPTKANTMIRCLHGEMDAIRLERQILLEDELSIEVTKLKREIFGSTAG